MKIFVTGASGFIGSAIVADLLAAGHDVVGLARSNKSADAITAAGATVLRGSLTDADILHRGATDADGVIHTAFIHDFSNLAASAEVDERAIATIGAALAGSNRPFVVTSAIGLLARGHVGTEADTPDRTSPGAHRANSEETALSLAEQGVRVSVVRLPSSVHGAGDYGFIPMVINIARTKGVSAYPGEGVNRWAAVHRLDAARLYRLALESAPAGARLHAIGDEGVQTRDIADVIGRQLHIPVESVPTEQAVAHFGWLGAFFGADIVASSAITQQRLGWHPTEPTLLEDLGQGYYFANVS